MAFIINLSHENDVMRREKNLVTFMSVLLK